MFNLQKQFQENNNIFGDFLENIPPSQEYLILSFSPSSIPLHQRWRNNYLSADFLADYLSTFFPSGEKQSSQKKEEIKSAVSYISNELLENAVKYSDVKLSSPISLQIHLNKDYIIFKLTNTINLNRVNDFQKYLQELTSSDTNELYIYKLEESALNEDEEESGLGFLTMINDYNAKLGWKFEQITKQIQEMVVTTMVQLKI